MAILFGFRSVGKETLQGESGCVEGAEGPRGAGWPNSPWRHGGLRELQGGYHFLVAVMKLFSMQRTMKAC